MRTRDQLLSEALALRLKLRREGKEPFEHEFKISEEEELMLANHSSDWRFLAEKRICGLKVVVV